MLLLPPYLIFFVLLSKINVIIIIIITYAHYSYVHALQCLNLYTLYKGGHKIHAIQFIKFHLSLKFSSLLSNFPLRIVRFHQFSVGCPCTNCPSASNFFLSTLLFLKTKIPNNVLYLAVAHLFLCLSLSIKLPSQGFYCFSVKM